MPQLTLIGLGNQKCSLLEHTISHSLPSSNESTNQKHIIIHSDIRISKTLLVFAWLCSLDCPHYDMCQAMRPFVLANFQEIQLNWAGFVFRPRNRPIPCHTSHITYLRWYRFPAFPAQRGLSSWEVVGKILKTHLELKDKPLSLKVNVVLITPSWWSWIPLVLYFCL